MKLCWFDDFRLGVVRGEEVIDVTGALDRVQKETYPRPSGDPVISHLDSLRPEIESLAVSGESRRVDSVLFRSPVARPTKIIGTPANYLKHVEEAAAETGVFRGRYVGSVREQGLFLKAVSSLVGSGEGVRLRFPERRNDHEMELGVVIGRRGSQIPESRALEYIAGYAIALDMVVRGSEDRSFRKSIDSYAVLGPWLVTAEEIQEPDKLNFSLSVNGELRQSSNTRYMILSIAQQIAWASEFYTLWPGDILMTGTCEGVGPVRPGDVMRCEIERIGVMDVHVS